jgi:hypothetical protein
MTITIQPRWSLGRGKTLVPSRWQATHERPAVSDQLSTRTHRLVDCCPDVVQVDVQVTTGRGAVDVLDPQERVAVNWQQGRELLMLPAAGGQARPGHLLPERRDLLGTRRIPRGVQERRQPPDLHHRTLPLHVRTGDQFRSPRRSNPFRDPRVHAHLPMSVWESGTRLG